MAPKHIPRVIDTVLSIVVGAFFCRSVGEKALVARKGDTMIYSLLVTSVGGTDSNDESFSTPAACSVCDIF